MAKKNDTEQEFKIDFGSKNDDKTTINSTDMPFDATAEDSPF